VARPRRTSRRTLTTLIVLVLVSVTIISIDESGRTHSLTSGVRSVADDVFTPLRNGTNDVLRPIGNFFAGSVNYGSVVQENHNLQRELGQLRLQLNERPSLERQLQEVLALQHLPFLGSIPTVMAQTEVINISNFAATIQIDKGRSEGVTLGLPVVGAGGLAGQVVAANHNTATVRLVTDGQSKVGVNIGTSPNQATVDGQGPGTPMTVDFIAPGTPIHKGEVLYTNGLAGAEYPPGIPVAYVTSIKTLTGASQLSVTAEPMANLDQLSYVAVVQWQPTP
jgi:rod shape-determining protein MreC